MRTSSTSKYENTLLFSIFVDHFFPHGSGSSNPEIMIHMLVGGQQKRAGGGEGAQGGGGRGRRACALQGAGEQAGPPLGPGEVLR